jgi:ferrochelatase
MFDAVLLLSFGGPEGPDDVMPFLRNVTRGRGVPDSRLAAVAEHYYHYAGVSPINQQNRLLRDAIEADFAAHGVRLPVYWGNRNWDPYVTDVVRQMRDDGVRKAAAFVTSAYGGYSACAQYLEDITKARAAVGAGAPEIVKLPQYAYHDGFVLPHADAVGRCLKQLPAPRLATTRILYSAHSIPVAMDASSGVEGNRYSSQLHRTAELVTARLAAGVSAVIPPPWELVWQSRSGSPATPWLEPDINDRLRQLSDEGVTDVVVSPIGFVSDHLEVLWDLDEEAAAVAEECGLGYARAATPGTDLRFVAMVRDLVTTADESLAAAGSTSLPPTVESECCGANCCGRG